MQYNTCIIYSNSSIMKVISKRQQLAKETPNKVEKKSFRETLWFYIYKFYLYARGLLQRFWSSNETVNWK